MLYNVVLVSAIHQHEPAIGIACLLPLEPPSHSHPIPSLEVVTELWVELTASYSKSTLAVRFTYGEIYVLMLLSQFIPLSQGC